VAWHQQKRQPGSEYQVPARLLHPEKDLDAKGVLESCGRCHYKHIWRYAIDEDPRVGFNEIAISQNHESACFKGGMSCLSCHQMHGGKRWAMRWEENDDAQCAQCHPKLVAASQPHTRHKDVRCVDCHMPNFLTGVLHTLRDHSMRSPEPELTERYQAANAPNACSNCHQDRSLSWMREWKAKWWKPTPQRMIDNVGLVVDLRRRARVETHRLVTTAEDPANELFFRLTAMRKLAELSDEAARSSLRRLLSDPHEEVRQLACAGIAEQPHPEAAAPLLKLLEDPVRTVRVEAAYALARCGWRGSSPAFERVYSDAVKMLDPQKAFDDILERLVPLADAGGKNREMAEHLAPLFRNPNRPRTMGDLLQRRGRILAEEGNHAGALDFYGQAVDQFLRTSGQTLPDLLYIDHAASLHALGRRQEAGSDWQQLLAQARPGSVPQLIASARLASLSGVALKETQALEAAVDRLKDEAWAGELLRRARWEINTLSSSPRR
jgi:tetratricopeptide (TPR) repeat protein